MAFRTRSWVVVGLWAGLASLSMLGSSWAQDAPPEDDALMSEETTLTAEEIEDAANGSSLLDISMSILSAPDEADSDSRSGDELASRPALSFDEKLSLAFRQLSDDVNYSINRMLTPADGSAPGDELDRIIGGDNRSRVTNTTGVPYKAICYLVVSWPDGGYDSAGTAEFVGPRVLLSNGHLVYQKARGGWAKSIKVIPAKNGTSEPCGSAYAYTYYTSTSWINKSENNADADMSWIIMPNQSLYNRVGYAFGYKTTSDSDLRSTGLNMAGYPGDKPNGTMWFEFGGGNQQVYTSQYYHYLDTFKGSSGSPMWQLLSGKRYIVGVNCAETSSYNVGTRMTSTYFNWTSDRIRQYP